jgi:hypothetical protein
MMSVQVSNFSKYSGIHQSQELNSSTVQYSRFENSIQLLMSAPLRFCLPLFAGESPSAPHLASCGVAAPHLYATQWYLAQRLPMARGNKKNISDETKQHVIHLRYSRHRKQVDIASDLRISLSSVKKILSSYRRDSQGLRVPKLRVRGRPRILQTADVDVSPSTQSFLRDPQFFQFVIGFLII